MANDTLVARIFLFVILGSVPFAVPWAGPTGVSAQPSQTGEFGRADMLLISASMADDNDGLVRLLRAGADPAIADASGRTPLMWAAMRQSEVNIKALLDAGADPCAQDVEGHTALWHSMRRTLDFTLPYGRGAHGTIFLRRMLPTRVTHLLVASGRCTRP